MDVTALMLHLPTKLLVLLKVAMKGNIKIVMANALNAKKVAFCAIMQISATYVQKNGIFIMVNVYMIALKDFIPFNEFAIHALIIAKNAHLIQQHVALALVA